MRVLGQASVVKSIFKSMLALSALACAFGGDAFANEGPQPTGAVVFDGGFAYWPEIGPETTATSANNGGGESKPNPIVASVVQFDIATGLRKVLFSTRSDYKTYIDDVHATGGRVAFTATTYSKSKSAPNVKREITKLYAMGVSDTVATALEEQTMTYRGRYKWIKKKHKKKYREFVIKSSCGASATTQDVSDTGVTLVTRSTVPCRKVKSKRRATASHSGSSYTAYGYSAGSRRAGELGPAFAPNIRLRFYSLIGPGGKDDLLLKGLPDVDTPPSDISLPVGGYATDIEFGPQGHFAVVANRSIGKSNGGHSTTQLLSIIPWFGVPGPAPQIPLPSGQAGDAAFCAAHVLLVAGDNNKYGWQSDRPTGGSLTLSLYDYNGVAVNATTTAPLGEFLGAGCHDRTALIATKEKSGVVVSAYPL